MRSLLFVPGDDEKKLAKALASEADALIVDLEDSVAFAAKPAARHLAAAFVSEARRREARPRLLCASIRSTAVSPMKISTR